ncbi:MAG: hypothetical protein JSW11_18900 [Candidatus Heimdallarchaeota archaeon]|nr:MAG: hypothetical protein JSW11_18900 [Candidatus Heimdallarchaeota archaeon]
MLQAKTLQNKHPVNTQFLKNVGIEFDLLLLGMMTVFNLELTEKQICQNIKNLLKALQLPISKGLKTIVKNNLSFLHSNGLIVRQKGKFIVSEKGEPLGMRILTRFRQIFTN